MKKKLFSAALAMGIATAAGLIATSPADAAGSSDTTVTFTLTGGGLAISAPATADLGSAATTATTVSGSLGTVTVDDTRGMLAATWTVTASSSSFTTGSGASTTTIPATSVTYTPGLAASSSTAVTVPTVGVLNAPLPVMVGTGVGNNSANWNPTISVLLPGSGAVAGKYTGTITQSVS